MAVTYKDIDQLSQKSSVVGTEKLPVSDTEYITPSQIVANDQKFYFVDGSSSQAGNSTSGSYLSTKWEGTIPGVTTLVNGLKIAYRIKTNTGVATAGAVLSIDGGTTYKPVVFNVNSVITTRYSVGSTILLTYNSTQTATAYLSSGTKSTVTGCWQIMDYDANTNTQVRQYQYGEDADGTSPEYPLLARYALTNKNGSYDTNYSNYHTGATLNTSTGSLTATSFKKSGGTSGQFLKADGSVDSNSYALASAITPAPGTLDTTATTAQSTSSSEALSGSVTLHKVAKTGTYSDLVGKPTVDSAPASSSSNLVSSGGVYTALQSKPNYTHLTDESEMPASPDASTLYLIDDDGSGSYTLPIASDTTLGGIKVGTGLSIDSTTGVLSATGGGSYTLPTASASTLGGVKVGDGLSINSSTGVLSTASKIVYLASESQMPANPDADTLYVILDSSSIEIIEPTWIVGGFIYDNNSKGYSDNGYRLRAYPLVSGKKYDIVTTAESTSTLGYKQVNVAIGADGMQSPALTTNGVSLGTITKLVTTNSGTPIQAVNMSYVASANCTLMVTTRATDSSTVSLSAVQPEP